MLVELLRKCGLLLLEPPTEEDSAKERKFWVDMRCRHSLVADKALFAHEYELLCTDERARSFLVSEEGSVFLSTRVVLPRVTHAAWDSRPVYLGDYAVALLPDRLQVRPSTGEGCRVTGLKIQCTASGRHDGMLRHRYYLLQGVGTFCFGARGPYLIELIGWKEHYQVLALVLDSLWHVNPEDRQEVERTFRCLQNDGTVEPAQGPILEGELGDAPHRYE